MGKIVNIGVDDKDTTPALAEIDPGIALNVRRCSACGGNHDGLIERELSGPAIDTFGNTGTHYYLCPITGLMVNIRHLD